MFHDTKKEDSDRAGGKNSARPVHQKSGKLKSKRSFYCKEVVLDDGFTVDDSMCASPLQNLSPHSKGRTPRSLFLALTQATDLASP